MAQQRWGQVMVGTCSPLATNNPLRHGAGTWISCPLDLRKWEPKLVKVTDRKGLNYLPYLGVGGGECGLSRWEPVTC